VLRVCESVLLRALRVKVRVVHFRSSLRVAHPVRVGHPVAAPVPCVPDDAVPSARRRVDGDIHDVSTPVEHLGFGGRGAAQRAEEEIELEQATVVAFSLDKLEVVCGHDVFSNFTVVGYRRHIHDSASSLQIMERRCNERE
jgi:hypothetical protein